MLDALLSNRSLDAFVQILNGKDLASIFVSDENIQISNHTFNFRHSTRYFITYNFCLFVNQNVSAIFLYITNSLSYPFTLSPACQREFLFFFYNFFFFSLSINSSFSFLIML